MIIGFVGSKGSGKDTAAQILRFLSLPEEFSKTTKDIIADWEYNWYCTNESHWKIKKFAGATTKAFKEITKVDFHSLSRLEKENQRELYIEFAEKQKEIFGEDVWVDALMKDYYNPCELYKEGLKENCLCYRESDNSAMCEYTVPYWLITDVRFPNEIKAIKDRGGIIVHIDRWVESYINKKEAIERFENNLHVLCVVNTETEFTPESLDQIKEHEGRFAVELPEDPQGPENLLKGYTFDYRIDNNQGIDYLIYQLRKLYDTRIK